MTWWKDDEIDAEIVLILTSTQYTLSAQLSADSCAQRFCCCYLLPAYHHLMLRTQLLSSYQLILNAQQQPFERWEEIVAILEGLWKRQ